jgi:hypothetical protein
MQRPPRKRRRFDDAVDLTVLAPADRPGVAQRPPGTRPASGGPCAATSAHGQRAMCDAVCERGVRGTLSIASKPPLGRSVRSRSGQ